MVTEICFPTALAILQALKEPMTPQKIAKCLNEDVCRVKHVLESALENGLLIKIGRKFDWSYKMKFPKRCRGPRRKCG